jgi:uncharacterized membrane protein YuzA (DUF378 family)
MKFNLETVIVNFWNFVSLLIAFNAINTGLIAYNGQDLTVQIQNPYNRYVKLAIGLAGVYFAYNFVKNLDQNDMIGAAPSYY